jgi:hypothetical protein
MIRPPLHDGQPRNLAPNFAQILVCSIAETRFGIQNSLGKLNGEGRYSYDPQPNDWRQLAEQASKEVDPQKMMSLVHELNRVLEQREQTSRQRGHQE